MSRIPVHTLDSAPEGARPMLERLARRSGTLLNIYTEMAHAPVVLAAYAGMREAIATHGSFDPATREAIALTVGAVDGCDYCQAAHTISARKAGLAEQQTIAIRRGGIDFDDKLAALLTVLREAAGNLGEVSDATWQAARDAGWSERELTEAFAHLAVNMFTNYFNHYARTDLDVPAAPPIEAS
jgi:AhpD family alkylhydroperoxidase